MYVCVITTNLQIYIFSGLFTIANAFLLQFATNLFLAIHKSDCSSSVYSNQLSSSHIIRKKVPSVIHTANNHTLARNVCVIRIR